MSTFVPLAYLSHINESDNVNNSKIFYKEDAFSDVKFSLTESND